MMWCEHCGYRRAMRGLIVCKKCLGEFGINIKQLKIMEKK